MSLPDIQYVIRNKKEANLCNTCPTMWIIFDFEGNDSVYRLTPNPDSMCDACNEIDHKLESDRGFVMSLGKWISRDEFSSL